MAPRVVEVVNVGTESSAKGGGIEDRRRVVVAPAGRDATNAVSLST